MAVAINFALVLDRLFPGENPHPMACSSGVTYAELANEKWRGSRPIPTEAELQAVWDAIQTEQPELFDPVLASRKQAKLSLAGKDPAMVRSRSTARLQLKIIKRFAGAILNRLVTAGTITQPQATAIAGAIPSWTEFQTELAAEIDADVVSG